MKKRTLKFQTLIEMAVFCKSIPSGFLMNTVNLTLTAIFDDKEIYSAEEKFHAQLIRTTDKVFSYHQQLD